jgi:hypothetical protein
MRRNENKINKDSLHMTEIVVVGSNKPQLKTDMRLQYISDELAGQVRRSSMILMYHLGYGYVVRFRAFL